VNVGRIFGEARGAAVGRIDLLSTAMHEIGHALGLDDTYVGFRNGLDMGLFIRITSPRPHAGIKLFLFGPNQSHLAGVLRLDEDQVTTPTVLMVPKPTPGTRQLITGVDALAVAQLSSFKRPNIPKK
jgi:hypothetical protein